MSFNCKYPIYLDKNSSLTRLLILDFHDKVLHSGVKDTLNELRSAYWVTQGRRTVKSVITNCFTCKKANSKAFKKLPTAPLPGFRVKVDSPFTYTGIDYLGPLLVKNIFDPKEELYKVHIVLYTCASSRAVHLDLVPDISCIAFVRSLKGVSARNPSPEYRKSYQKERIKYL